MSPVNPIERFLHGHLYGAKPGDAQQLARIRPFVTISGKNLIRKSGKDRIGFTGFLITRPPY